MAASPRYIDMGTMISREIRETSEKINYLLDGLGDLLNNDLPSIDVEISGAELLPHAESAVAKRDLVDDLRAIKQNAGSIRRFAAVRIKQDMEDMIKIADALDTRTNQLLYKLEYAKR